MELIFSDDSFSFNKQIEHFIIKNTEGIFEEAKLNTSYNLKNGMGEATLKHYNNLIIKNDLGQFDLVPYQEKQLIRHATQFFEKNNLIEQSENATMEQEKKITPFEILDGEFRNRNVKVFIGSDQNGCLYKSPSTNIEGWERITNEHHAELSEELISKKVPIEYNKTYNLTNNRIMEKNQEKKHEVENYSAYVNKPGVTLKAIESKNSVVANFSVNKGDKDNKVFTKVEAWGPLSEKMKEVQPGEKVTISGEYKPNNYKGKDGNEVNEMILVAKEISLHKLLEITGEVGAVTPADKYLDVKLFVNNGTEKADLYNLRVFGDDKSKFENIKPSDQISIKADVQFREYDKEGQKMTAYNAVLKELHNHVVHEKNKTSEKEVAAEKPTAPKKEAEASKPKPKTKAKDKGVSM